jgi:Zn-dependent M16 (insulinase) family peptidase
VTGLEYYSAYLDNLRKTTLKDVSGFVRTYLVKKPHLTSVLLSPKGAEKAKLKDTSKDLLKKHLGM